MSDTWNLMNNWNLVIPPSRPSARQLELLYTLASCIDRSLNVAVLGSTIEYRDLLYELNFKNIYVFDRNKEFFNLTNEYRIYNNKELFICGDWLDTLEKYQNSFSLIVSDLTSGNVPYDERSKFYKDIENAVINGGIFFDKILTHNNNFLSIENLFKKYKELPLNLVTVNYFNCEVLFCSDLLKENEIVNTKRFYQKLESMTNNKRILKYIEFVKLITPTGFIWYYGKNWNELKQNYCIHLKLINEIDDDINSPYYGFVKIFCYKK